MLGDIGLFFKSRRINRRRRRPPQRQRKQQISGASPYRLPVGRSFVEPRIDRRRQKHAGKYRFRHGADSTVGTIEQRRGCERDRRHGQDRTGKIFVARIEHETERDLRAAWRKNGTSGLPQLPIAGAVVPGAPVHAGEAAKIGRKRPPGLPLMQRDASL